MKSTLGIILFFIAAAVEKDSDAAYTYGPEHCVELSRSKDGTCVIETNCPADSIGNFTFDFLCTDGAGGQVIHSFGTGGFLDQETFDTGVTCHTCAPAEGGVLLTAESDEATTAAPAAAEEAVPPKSASFYGPGSCVASYRSPTGTCIVETRCTGKEEKLKEYNVGLTCVEAEGSTTRHLFGVNSFDPEETFDTLIPCKLCLGLDGEAIVAQNLTALAKSVSTLADGIEEVKKGVAEIKEQLKKKNTTKAETTEADVQSAPTGEDGGDGGATDGGADSAGGTQEFLSRKAKKSRRTRKTHARARHTKKAQYLTEDRVDDDMMDDSGDSIDDVDPDVDPDLELDSDA
jgi:hypothetical protein